MECQTNEFAPHSNLLEFNGFTTINAICLIHQGNDNTKKRDLALYRSIFDQEL
jgi:hypothetical protein